MSTLNGGPGNIVTEGLVLYLDAANYKSYTSGSTTWRDLTINGNNGTFINGPAFSSGNAGSIVFDGVDDYGTFPNLGGLSKFTVEAWFNPFAYPSGGSYPAVVSNTWDGNNVNFVIGWSFISINTIFVGFLNGPTGGFWRTINGISIDLNKNVSVTMTFADNLMVAYKNGSFFNSLIPNLTPTSTTQNLIGRRWDNPNYFNGQINGIKIYNRALSATEVLQNYNATKTRFGL